MGERSEQMRAYRDALDRHGIPWADDTTDTGEVGGFRMRIERTATELDGERVSVIWGWQQGPDGRRRGATIGWPAYLEVWYRPVHAEPLAATLDDIMREVFGVREGSR